MTTEQKAAEQKLSRDQYIKTLLHKAQILFNTYKSRPLPLAILGVMIIMLSVTIFLLPSAIQKSTQPTVAAVQPQHHGPMLVVSTLIPTPFSSVSTVPTKEIADAVGTVTQAPPTPTITPTFTPTPTLDPTINWLTYTNTQLHYSVKYPATWHFRDLGALEPKIPDWVTFDQLTASPSSRSITISESTRTFQEQITIGGQGSPVIVDSIHGIQQWFQDSNGYQSVAIVLPRASDILILRSKTNYITIFNQMLSTLKTSL